MPFTPVNLLVAVNTGFQGNQTAFFTPTGDPIKDYLRFIPFSASCSITCSGREPHGEWVESTQSTCKALKGKCKFNDNHPDFRFDHHQLG
jgi:hypothetical protein